MPRRIERKVWFCRSFWLFLYVLELNSFLAPQIFPKLQEIVNSINIYILPCKLDLCAKWNWATSEFIFTFWKLIHFRPRKFQLNFRKLSILLYIFILWVQSNPNVRLIIYIWKEIKCLSIFYFVNWIDSSILFKNAKNIKTRTPWLKFYFIRCSLFALDPKRENIRKFNKIYTVVFLFIFTV